MKGFEESFKVSYRDLNARLHESGHAHPVSCVDCHDPTSMPLRGHPRAQRRLLRGLPHALHGLLGLFARARVARI